MPDSGFNIDNLLISDANSPALTNKVGVKRAGSGTGGQFSKVAKTS